LGKSDCHCLLKGKTAVVVKCDGYALFIYKFCFVSFIVVFLFSKGLLCDLLWSDPDKDVQGWGENDRGVSFTFGADVVSKFLNRHDLDLICRAHQVGNRSLLEILLFVNVTQSLSFYN
jgi:hypothetical protein